MSVMNLDREYVANTYKRFPLEIVSGSGSVVRDAGGRDDMERSDRLEHGGVHNL